MAEQTNTAIPLSLYPEPHNTDTTEEEVPDAIPLSLFPEIDNHHDTVCQAIKADPEASQRSLCEWQHRLRLRFAKDTQSENIFLHIGKYYDNNLNFSQINNINNIQTVSWVDTDYSVYTCNEKSHHQFLKIGNIFLDKRTFNKYNLWIISRYNAEFSLSDDSDTQVGGDEAINNRWGVPFLLRAIRKEMKKISSMPDAACQSRQSFSTNNNGEEITKKTKKSPSKQNNKGKSTTTHRRQTSTSKDKYNRGRNSMTIIKKNVPQEENRQPASEQLHKASKRRRSDDNASNIAVDALSPLLPTTKRRKRENEAIPSHDMKSSAIVIKREPSIDMDIDMDTSLPPPALISAGKQPIKAIKKATGSTLISSATVERDDQSTDMDIDVEVSDLPAAAAPSKEKRHRKTAEKIPTSATKSSNGTKKEQQTKKSKSDKHVNNALISPSMADKINETGQKKSDTNKVKKNQSIPLNRTRKTDVANPTAAQGSQLTERRSKRTKIKRPNIIVHKIDPERSLCWNMENYIINDLFNDSHYQLDCREMLQKFSKKARRRRERLCNLWKRYGRKFFEIQQPNEDGSIFHDTDAGTHPNGYVDISSDLLLNELDIKSDYETIVKILNGIGARFDTSVKRNMIEGQSAESHFTLHVKDLFDLLRHLDDELMADWYEIYYKNHVLYVNARLTVYSGEESVRVNS